MKGMAKEYQNPDGVRPGPSPEWPRWLLLAVGQRPIDLLVDLNRSHGITFLLVTHEEEIARKCTRIVTIRDGLIVSDEQLVESSDSEE